jgi:hypothetical protein
MFYETGPSFEANLDGYDISIKGSTFYLNIRQKLIRTYFEADYLAAIIIIVQQFMSRKINFIRCQ